MSVDGPSLAEVERFDLHLADTTTVVKFVVGALDLSDGGLPAPHLRDHLVSGEPITVDYEVRNSAFVALRYVDAPR